MTRLTQHLCDALASALKKVTSNGGRELCGYLTPMEIVALVDIGHASFSPSQTRVIEQARAQKTAGTANPWWFYFQLPKSDKSCFSQKSA